ncbi:MAG: hypothetical protein M3Y56_01665, partial [Armatimonadota bacterium]|nr:hypothetical protein [Armatimonadota bacterium]
MSITLELQPELEEKLREAAAQQGKAVETYLLELAQQNVPDESIVTPVVPNGAPPPGSLAE